jgi:DNA-binding NtrC family response regulator
MKLFWPCRHHGGGKMYVPPPMLATLLVVDDDPAARYAMARVFEGELRVVEAATIAEGRERLPAELPAVVLLDYNLPDGDGLELLREIGDAPESPAVIMITAHGSERVAVEAMKAGAYDYLTKPYDIDELRLTVSRALERQQLRSEVCDLRERLAAEGQFGRMIGASQAMRELFVLAEQVARTDLPVLLLGESGAGKDMLAQEIHARSPRAAQRFVALNCAAVPETLVESELFGYVKGAFTGATSTRAGKFELAQGGTLFLDEIGDMAPPTQAKILRAAESGAVERLGDSKSLRVDVRLISATNQDLESAIRESRFRQDLYFRLAGVSLYLPPLRQRREDIPLLVEVFWDDLRRKYDRIGPELSREALLSLEEAPWPGNVRQLRNAVERLFVLAREGKVTKEDVADAVRLGPVAAAPADDLLAPADFREARSRFEAAYLARKLREHQGNVTRTAAAIGLERQSLQEKLKKLGIERE